MEGKTAEASEPVLDRSALLDQVEDDRDVLQAVIALFQEVAPARLAELRAAIAQGDAEALARAAHTLKGTLGSLGSRQAFQTARRLEMLGRSQDIGAAEAVFGALEAEVHQFGQALEAFAQEVS
jgi:HPt (histidine-containing phosphotransfer) domain-containing protein